MKNTITLLLFSLLIGFAHAQTGPGGIGNSTNNVLWLNADSINETNGSPVDFWRDLSGNNNHSVQNNLTSQPILHIDSINSHNLVSFDGLDDYMELTNHITSNDISIYLVLNNSLANTSVSRYAITTEDHYFLSQHSTEKTALIYSNTRYNVVDWVSTKLEMVSGQTGSNLEVHTSRRGKDRLFTNRAPLNSNSQSLIGALFDGTSASGFHSGSIAEVAVFNETLNVAERKIIMNALTAKYGSNMVNSSDDLYAFQNTHHNDMIGIGQESGFSHTDSRGNGVLQISNPNDLANGEYLMTGHDNAPLALDTSDVPTGFESRLERVWRSDKIGDLGTVTTRFYIDASVTPDLSNTYVLIDDDGDFSNGGTTIHDFGRSIDVVNGFVSFSNVDLEDDSYFTLGVYDEDNIIRSVQNGDWNVPSTWDCNCVPDLNSIVSIVDRDVVELTTEQSVNVLTIEADATFNLNPSTIFHIYDSLNIQGVMNNIENLVTTEGDQEVGFTSSRTDTVNFYSLEINSTEGLSLNNANWSLQHTVRVNADALTNNGTFIFLSNDTLTAQILTSVSNSFNGGGDYILQRYISERKSAYANMASPTTTTLADWDEEIYMSGVGGNDGNAKYGYSPTSPIYYSVYEYDNVSQTYDTITSTSKTLEPGQGYELFLGDDLVEYTPVELGTIDVWGTPTTGTVSATVNTGFCLLGNPYQSFVNWALVSKPTSVPNSYYVFDANSGNYALYSSSTLIPPGQAFWIQGPTGGIRTVTFEENDKALNNNANTSTFLRTKQSNADTLLFTITNDVNDFWHEHIVELNNFSSIEEDERDISYLPSRARGVPALYSTIESEIYGGTRELMINSIGTNEESQSIDLHLKAGTEANYTIEVKDLQGSNTYSCMILEDKHTNTLVDLNEMEEYSFYSEEGKFDRFTLHLNRNTLDCKSSAQINITGISIDKYNGEYYINYNLKDQSDQINIRILDALGREVKDSESYSIQNSGQIKLNTNDLNGIYLINVESQNGRSISNKFYFQ